ncbi:hypothetical protein [Mycobacterium sp. 050134]
MAGKEVLFDRIAVATVQTLAQFADPVVDIERKERRTNQSPSRVDDW